jgi:hypothetical protein
MSAAVTARNGTVRTAEKDRQLIMEIVSRAVDEAVTIFLRGDLVGLEADLARCRRRLDLKRLSAAGKDEFFQEIIRINRSIDRKTGKLPEAFTPRFLKKKEAVKA